MGLSGAPAWRALAGAAGLGAASAASAASGAWVGLCDSAAGGGPGRVLGEYRTPGGTRSTLEVAAKPRPGCEGIELPVPPDAIVGGRRISREVAESIATGYALMGRETSTGFRVTEIVPRDERIARSPLPAGVDVSAEVQARPYGIEERARLERVAGRWRLACAAGEKPAGALILLPARGLPRGIGLAAALSYEANERFSWSVSDERRSAKGDPVTLGALAAGTATVRVPLPRGALDLASVDAFSLACPREAARLDLHSLAIEPRSPATRSVPRAAWAWKAEAWIDSPEALLDKLARTGAGTVFATVPIEADRDVVANPRELERFVRAARERGIAVWAVVGDPAALIESGRAAFARHPAAFERYNRGVARAARLAGIQYDIEPYLNPDYALDPGAWHEAYLATLDSLRRVADMPVDVAVPFWWADRETPAGTLLDRLAPRVQGITAMAYRTDADAIKRAAQPFLEWGARHDRAVRIALEAGPIDDEVLRHFRPAPKGEGALLAIGARRVLLEFDRAIALPEAPEGSRAYARSHETAFPGSRLSFAGRREALLAMLPGLESLWAAWPAFAGTALHEFDPPDR